MSKANEPAFPGFNKFPVDPGLTKREYFAAMAMQGLLACPMGTQFSDYVHSPTECAMESVMFADALIAELEKEKS